MGANEPLVSIITVSYNSEKTIKDTIKSVLNQTYANVEYIIVDGLSKDETVKIAKSYESLFRDKGYTYTVVSEKDNGIYDAMNKGIRMAHGDIIGIINSDDWYEENAIEKAVDEYKKTGFEFFYADLRLVKGSQLKVKKSKMRKFATSRDWNHPTTFIVREFYQKYQYKNEGLYSDFDLWLKARKNGHKIVILNEVLANFRFGGISNKKNIKMVLDRIKERYNIYKDNGYSRWYIFECIAIEGIKLFIA